MKQDESRRDSADSRTGLWMIGARGAVATTTIVGVLAAVRDLVPIKGVTTMEDRGEGLDLPDPASIVFGGWELRPTTLVESARALAGSARIFEPLLVRAIEDDLCTVDEDIVTGGATGRGESPRRTIARLRADLAAFRDRHELERVVVVNLASTEPAFRMSDEHLSLEALEEALDRNDVPFRPSILYAYAALREGAAFLNFAASPAALVPAIRELAGIEGVPFMGTDGKTGETLVKSALAPMFRERSLEVLSWHGSNILGNSDGEALDHPEVRAAKAETKDAAVRSILGYSPETSVDIRYVPSLGDWKTAWDLIHFEGFLGTRMTMQFTWQGADSILAAPLVIDLTRLADLALRRRESGAMTHASCFFKSPVGTREHELSRQYAALDRYLRRARLSIVRGRDEAVG